MHAILFSLKRVHQRFLLRSRDLIASFGITPARFDMLHAIDQSYAQRIYQSSLRRALGVTAATVSRMAKSLEELGLIARARCLFDRRQIVITLSPAGAALFTSAASSIFCTCVVDFALECVLAIDPRRAFEELVAFGDRLDHARGELLDLATLYYPFHPDD
jgi:DNA-binding MarR family transcriptional regulator